MTLSTYYTILLLLTTLTTLRRFKRLTQKTRTYVRLFSNQKTSKKRVSFQRYSALFLSQTQGGTTIQDQICPKCNKVFKTIAGSKKITCTACYRQNNIDKHLSPKNLVISQQIAQAKLRQDNPQTPPKKIPLQVVWIDEQGNLVECEVIYSANLSIALRTIGTRVMQGRDPTNARGFYIRATIDQSLTTLFGTAAQRAKRG